LVGQALSAGGAEAQPVVVFGETESALSVGGLGSVGGECASSPPTAADPDERWQVNGGELNTSMIEEVTDDEVKVEGAVETRSASVGGAW
jgi:hypothetical protein